MQQKPSVLFYLEVWGQTALRQCPDLIGELLSEILKAMFRAFRRTTWRLTKSTPDHQLARYMVVIEHTGQSTNLAHRRLARGIGAQQEVVVCGGKSFANCVETDSNEDGLTYSEKRIQTPTKNSNSNIGQYN